MERGSYIHNATVMPCMEKGEKVTRDNVAQIGKKRRNEKLWSTVRKNERILPPEYKKSNSINGEMEEKSRTFASVG